MQHMPVIRVGEDEGGENRESQLKVSQAEIEGNIGNNGSRADVCPPIDGPALSIYLLIGHREASARFGVFLFPGQLKIAGSILVVAAVSG